MHDRDAYRLPKESIAWLPRSGWSTGETAWHAIAGDIVYQVDGSKDENRNLAESTTPREA